MIFLCLRSILYRYVVRVVSILKFQKMLVNISKHVADAEMLVEHSRKIYEVLMNEDAGPFMKAELADGTLGW